MNHHNHRESSYLPAYKAADIYVPIRHYICRESSTNQPFLCKTNPILSAVGGLQMNVNPYSTTEYENKSNWTLGQNKPNSNPIKPNLRKAKMNASVFATKDYRKKDDFIVRINKPNFQNAKNERKLNFNKGLQKKRLFSSPKNKPKTNPISKGQNRLPKNPATPVYTVRQLFDIVVLYKYHLPIINPFTPLLG